MINKATLLSVAFALTVSLMVTQPATAGVITFSTQSSFNLATTGLTTQTFDFLNGDGPDSGVAFNNSLNSSTHNADVQAGNIIPGLDIAATTDYGDDLALIGPSFLSGSRANFGVFSNDGEGLVFTLNPGVTAFSLGVLAFDFSSDSLTSAADINVYDQSSNLLGSFTVGAPFTGTGGFWGVTATGTDTIGSVTLFTPDAFAAGVDRVQIGNAVPIPLPEPGTLSLMGTALLGLGGVLRRKLTA